MINQIRYCDAFMNRYSVFSELNTVTTQYSAIVLTVPVTDMDLLIRLSQIDRVVTF